MATKNLQELKNDQTLLPLIRAATEQRTQAEPKYGSSVGIAFEMYDGKIITGHNIELTPLNIHAEMMGMIVAHNQGYRGTDFRRMVEVFYDRGVADEKQPTYPACMTCWPWFKDLTHPYVQIIVVTVAGEIKKSYTFRELFAIPEDERYPANVSMIAKPRSNQKPKLLLAPELAAIRRVDPYFDEYCAKVLRIDEGQKPA